MCQTPHEVFSLYSPMDGWDCIREKTGESVTTYCIPEGQLLSFIRDGERFDCSCDALGSVRIVTDESSTVVLRRDFSAWGEELAGGFDSVPGGFHYGFIGSLGCRQDPATGLYYMRQRWYDPTLQRFISRDPIGLEGGINLYTYAQNSPSNFADPAGLAPASTKEKYEKFYRRWSKKYRIESIDGVEALRPQRGDTQGLNILCKQLGELSDCADSNSEFLTLVQAVYLSTGATKKYKVYKLYFFETSDLQDSKHYSMAPGMGDWQLAYQDKLGPAADNSHHLAAFLSAGFNRGVTEAKAAAEAIDIGNPGDVALGRLGAEYGDLLAYQQYEMFLSSEEQRQYRKHWIKALCSRLRRK